MGQNASTEKGSDSANTKKNRFVVVIRVSEALTRGADHESYAPQRPPIGNRRTSLELPDLQRALSPLNPRRSQPSPGPPAPTVPTPIPIPLNNSHPPVDHVPSPMTPSSNEPPDGRPTGRPEPPRELTRPNDHHLAQTPDAHIHSSIPLGIILQADGGASSAVDEVPNNLVPTMIKWRGGGGRSVQVSGTFESSWSRRITMVPDPNDPQLYTTVVRLRPGTHRIKFIIDDQWKCSDDLPTATDNDGHLVNYIEVPAASASAWDPSSETSAPETSRHQTPFGDIIPPHLLHSALLEEQYLSQQMANPPPIPHPAALPRHLERVILNTHRHTRERAVMDGHRDDNSVLPIPNHVVLNHLGTSAIKNGVLAVATTMRYHQKYISTLYFKPVSS